MASLSASAASHLALNRRSLFDLKDRVALVTGGGTGIGLMITQALAINGAKVYITSRDASKLETVVKTYNQDIEGEIIAIPNVDVTSKEDIVKLVQEISSREKCLCILVNNAGITGPTLTTEADSATEMKKNMFDNADSTFEDWTSTYQTNVAPLFFMTMAFLPLLQISTEMHPGWSGCVINTTSISGIVKSSQHHYAYNASKAAANHVTRMLANDVATNGLKVRVNAIAPGVFPSEMTAGDSDEFQKSHIPKEKYAEKVPASRPGKDEDMAQAVLFAVANQYLNGQVVVVDGGYTLAAGE